MSSMRDEIDEILVDCYGEDEEMSGWEVTFSDEVEVPFSALLLGMPVTVLGFRVNDALAMQCQVERENKTRWIGIEDLDNENLPDDFHHFLTLYQAWSSGKYE